LVPLIAVVATTAHPVAVARVLLRQQQARTRTVTSAADDPYPDDDDNDNNDALLTAAVPVIVDDEAAYYPLPPPPPLMNINKTPQFLLLLEVLPTDTFQGVCLRYRVTPTKLRRANKMLTMTGSSDFLKLAPEVLSSP
jgi:hypothetical protein